MYYRIFNTASCAALRFPGVRGCCGPTTYFGNICFKWQSNTINARLDLIYNSWLSLEKVQAKVSGEKMRNFKRT
jgi:hypothetical protein